MRVDRKHDDDEYMQSDEHEEDSPHASRHDEDGPTQSRAVPAVRSPLRRESLPATQSDRPPLRPVKSELDMPWRAASQAHQSSSANSATQQSQSSTIFPPLGSQIVRTTEEGIVYGAYVDGEYREMTLKGPKRKRLARACAACHKNKRRCDGFQPCTNCFHNERVCQYFNAQGERVDPPRYRDASVLATQVPSESLLPSGIERASPKASLDDHVEHAPILPSYWTATTSDDSAADLPEDYMHPLELVDDDAEVSLETIDNFFTRLSPFAMASHAPTFYYRMSHGLLAQYVLDSICALSNRFCKHPLFTRPYRETQPFQRGSFWAERASIAISAVIDARERVGSDTSNRDDVPDASTEVELGFSLFLLGAYLYHDNHSDFGKDFLDRAFALLITFRVKRPRELSQGSTPSSADLFAVSEEMRRRTLWSIIHFEILVSNPVDDKLKVMSYHKLGLPTDEARFARHGRAAIDLCTEPIASLVQEEELETRGQRAVIEEYGWMLRLLDIYRNVASLDKRSGSGSSADDIEIWEARLREWHNSLPFNLRFSQDSLRSYVDAMASRVPAIRSTGWIGMYMHMMAEVTNFVLCRARADAKIARLSSPQEGVERQKGIINGKERFERKQAVGNIRMMLDRMGVEGRTVPHMLPALKAITQDEDEDRLLDDTHKPDLQLEEWWLEMKAAWNTSRPKSSAQRTATITASTVTSQQTGDALAAASSAESQKGTTRKTRAKKPIQVDDVFVSPNKPYPSVLQPVHGPSNNGFPPSPPQVGALPARTVRQAPPPHLPTLGQSLPTNHAYWQMGNAIIGYPVSIPAGGISHSQMRMGQRAHHHMLAPYAIHNAVHPYAYMSAPLPNLLSSSASPVIPHGLPGISQPMVRSTQDDDAMSAFPSFEEDTKHYGHNHHMMCYADEYDMTGGEPGVA